MAPQRGRARRESPIASLDLSTVCQALCRQSRIRSPVAKKGNPELRGKVDRSLMNLDTYPRIGKPFISTFKSFFGFSSHSQVQPIHSGVTMMLCSAASRCSERLGTRCLIEEHRSLFFALRKTSVIYGAGVRTFPFFWARKIQKTSLNVNVSIFSRYMLIQCL